MKEGSAAWLAAKVDDRCAGVIARQTGPVFRANQSARSLTVDMTVDVLMGEEKASVYVVFPPLEIIELE